MDQDRIGILLAKYMAGELTSEEEEELEWAFLANPRLREALQLLWGMQERPPAGLSKTEEQAMLEKGLQQLKNPVASRYKGRLAPVESGAATESGATTERGSDAGKVRTLSRRNPGYRWVAAAIVFILIAGVVFWRYQSGPAVLAHSASRATRVKEIVTKYGTRSYQELPDGSKLWLNAGSKVWYADSFSDGKRELTLIGEAFFDIQHDPVHPFIIHTGGLDVKVLGTTLNVKAYPGDSAIETTLIKGKVEIDLKDRAGNNIVLHPSEKISIPVGVGPGGVGAGGTGLGGSVAGGAGSGRKPVSIKAVERKLVLPDSAYGTIVETSWVEDKLIFRNEKMTEVAARMERWYNIRIRFDDDKYQQQMLTGYFKDQPVENVMKALQVILGFHYRIMEDTIHIW